jgi:hypothetical protein
MIVSSWNGHALKCSAIPFFGESVRDSIFGENRQPGPLLLSGN